MVTYNTVSGATTAPTVSYVYDYDSTCAMTADGMLVRVTVGSYYRERYTFDATFRVSRTIRTIGSRTHTTSYSRKEAQNRKPGTVCSPFTPWRQEGEEIGAMYFALRSTGEPTALVSSVRQAVQQIDSNLPVTNIASQVTRSQESLGQERLYAKLLSFFGLALLLAAIGLSGVLAYSVAQRTNEIGIRMALGAQTANVLRLVIWQGMKLVLLGLAAGALAGYGLQRLLASQYFEPRAWQREVADQLYGVTVSDPLTFAAVASLLTLVALGACWLPARRASRVDPLTALRHE
jgi:ABC-type antimicrobial peptide transport system permease subunit